MLPEARSARATSRAGKGVCPKVGGGNVQRHRKHVRIRPTFLRVASCHFIPSNAYLLGRVLSAALDADLPRWRGSAMGGSQARQSAPWRNLPGPGQRTPVKWLLFTKTRGTARVTTLTP
eukprot:4637127-Amphidinium_carterae.1